MLLSQSVHKGILLTFVDSSDYLGKLQCFYINISVATKRGFVTTHRHNSITRDVAMVCQRIQTRTRATLVTIAIVRSLEGVFAGDYAVISLRPSFGVLRAYHQLEISVSSPASASPSRHGTPAF